MTESGGSGGGESATPPPPLSEGFAISSRAGRWAGVRMKKAPGGNWRVGGAERLFGILNPNWRLDEMHGKTPL